MVARTAALGITLGACLTGLVVIGACNRTGTDDHPTTSNDNSNQGCGIPGVSCVQSTPPGTRLTIPTIIPPTRPPLLSGGSLFGLLSGGRGSPPGIGLGVD